MRKLLLILTTAVCGASFMSARADEPAAKTPAKLAVHTVHNEMLQRNNQLRTGLGRQPHQLSEELTEAAQNHAEYMARTGQYSHYVNLGPGGRVRKFGYPGRMRGEIIHCTPRTVEKAFDGWMKSPPHRSILLGRSTQAGFGYAVSKGGTAYWVGVYGTPTPKPSETPAIVAKPTTTTTTSSSNVSRTSSRRRLLRRRR